MRIFAFVILGAVVGVVGSGFTILSVYRGINKAIASAFGSSSHTVVINNAVDANGKSLERVTASVREEMLRMQQRRGRADASSQGGLW